MDSSRVGVAAQCYGLFCSLFGADGSYHSIQQGICGDAFFGVRSYFQEWQLASPSYASPLQVEIVMAVSVILSRAIFRWRLPSGWGFLAFVLTAVNACLAGLLACYKGELEVVSTVSSIGWVSFLADGVASGSSASFLKLYLQLYLPFLVIPLFLSFTFFDYLRARAAGLSSQWLSRKRCELFPFAQGVAADVAPPTSTEAFRWAFFAFLRVCNVILSLVAQLALMQVANYLFILLLYFCVDAVADTAYYVARNPVYAEVIFIALIVLSYSQGLFRYRLSSERSWLVFPVGILGAYGASCLTFLTIRFIVGDAHDLSVRNFDFEFMVLLVMRLFLLVFTVFVGLRFVAKRKLGHSVKWIGLRDSDCW